jgi:hypothetical protein
MKSERQQKRKGLSGGVKEGPPPKQGPNPQVPPVKLKGGGCPYREPGAKSDIKGIKNIQVTGKKFIGLR